MTTNGDGHHLQCPYCEAYEVERLYQEACTAGHMLACNNLGGLYETALGVRRDTRRAIDLYDQACEGGEMRGCFNTARLYETGAIGGTPSTSQAQRYYDRACSGGYRTACEHVITSE